MSDLDPPSIAVFRQEAEDLLDQLENGLLDLETRPGDADLIATIFRALHTIKGSAAVFGLDRLSGFTHAVETVYNRVRGGEVAATPALIVATLAAKDHMRLLVAGETDDTGEPILASLTAAITSGGHSAATTTMAAPPAPSRTYRIRFKLPENAFAIGTDPALVIVELLALGHGRVVGADGSPKPLAETDERDYRRDWEVELTTTRPASDIEDVFLFIRDSTEIAIEPVASEAAKSAKSTEAVVKVGSGRIDDLIDRMGELVIADSRLRDLSQRRDDPELLAVAEEIERLTAGLRDVALGIRMVPIGALFARFRRPVHDLARDLGKEVHLVTSGEETEMDKAMVECLHDPLLHLIRNAVGHGIEDPATRRSRGKPEAGSVTLAAAHVGAEVLISITDDGSGLDCDRIRAKAVALGILAADAAPNEAEIAQFIFHPGFSTAATVSNISGRGVGLDVVKTSIEGLRGAIDVSTRLGLGTTITLRLPLTLAIIDGLLVRVGEQRYVIPMAMV